MKTEIPVTNHVAASNHVATFPDLYTELANILQFCSVVGSTIHHYGIKSMTTLSSHCRDAVHEVAILGEFMRNLHFLSIGLASRSEEDVLFACNLLLTNFEVDAKSAYVHHRIPVAPTIVFEKHPQLDVPGLIATLKSIQQKIILFPKKELLHAD